MNKQQKELLQEIRLVSDLTGVVSPVQEQSVAMWPHAIPQVKAVVTVISSDAHLVLYDLKLKWFKGKNIDRGIIQHIETSVWMVLGDTWRTIFVADGKIVHDGKRRKEFNVERTDDPEPKP